MKDFFIYETEIPQGAGFQLFGWGHFAWLAGILLFAGVFSVWYAGQNEKTKRIINRVMGTGLLLSGVIRDTFLMIRGYFGVGFFPIHLCSIALMIAFIYSFTENRFLGMVYLLLCIPGAFAALLFPDWSRYPFFTYMNINAFLSHGFLIVFGVMHYVSGKLVPGWRDIWKPALFGLAGTLLVYPFNQKYGTNFWFLNRPSKGSPLVGLADMVGMDYYLPTYLAVCMLIIFFWHTVMILLAKSYKRGILKEGEHKTVL